MCTARLQAVGRAGPQKPWPEAERLSEPRFSLPLTIRPRFSFLTHCLPLDYRRKPSANKSQTLPPSQPHALMQALSLPLTFPCYLLL